MTTAQRKPWSGLGALRRVTARPDIGKAEATPQQTESSLPVAVGPNVGDLAWHLAAAMTDSMKPADRAHIYLLLGCGDHYDAIVDMIEQARIRHVELTADVRLRLGQWITGYRGTAAELSLRALLDPS